MSRFQCPPRGMYSSIIPPRVKDEPCRGPSRGMWDQQLSPCPRRERDTIFPSHHTGALGCTGPPNTKIIISSSHQGTYEGTRKLHLNSHPRGNTGFSGLILQWWELIGREEWQSSMVLPGGCRSWFFSCLSLARGETRKSSSPRVGPSRNHDVQRSPPGERLRLFTTGPRGMFEISPSPPLTRRT